MEAFTALKDIHIGEHKIEAQQKKMYSVTEENIDTEIGYWFLLEYPIWSKFASKFDISNQPYGAVITRRICLKHSCRKYGMTWVQ